jgi:hypothetical protein
MQSILHLPINFPEEKGRRVMKLTAKGIRGLQMPETWTFEKNHPAMMPDLGKICPLCL